MLNSSGFKLICRSSEEFSVWGGEKFELVSEVIFVGKGILVLVLFG